MVGENTLRKLTKRGRCRKEQVGRSRSKIKGDR
jgi:hypothetical protein